MLSLPELVVQHLLLIACSSETLPCFQKIELCILTCYLKDIVISLFRFWNHIKFTVDDREHVLSLLVSQILINQVLCNGTEARPYTHIANFVGILYKPSVKLY